MAMYLFHYSRVMFFLICLTTAVLANLNIRIVLPQSEHNSLESIGFRNIVSITPQGTIRILGTLTYWDSANIQRPLVWARVWICDREPNGQDFILVERFTDTNGQFDSGAIVNDDGPGEDGFDIVFYFVAWNNVVQVIDSQSNRYFALDGPYNDMADGTYQYTASMPQGHGAWMIFSYHNGITAGWNYLNTQVNYQPAIVTCRWPVETWPHYHPGGEIHLPDWACWWPDIILHEYGHHVMYSLYGYIPPTMTTHSIEKQSNTTTAWAEGWANFYPLMVFNDPVFTWSNGTHYADINLETLHWCSSGWDDGDQVEGRVAGALWDIFDSQNDNAPWYYDSFSDGFQRVWNILSAQTDNTFKEFWDAWNASGYPKQPALMAIFQNSIDYRGPGDINADGEVDSVDFGILGNAWGAFKGDPNWDQRADLYYDDVVDSTDLGILSANWGNHYDC